MPITSLESMMKEIQSKRKLFEPYGLAFRESVIRNAQGNPVFYADTANTMLRKGFEKLAVSSDCESQKKFFPLVEGFGRPWFPGPYSPKEIDFRWEREWRVVGDFWFRLEDVAFGICPKEFRVEFEVLTEGKVRWLSPRGDG
jgi:hypothetical protein